MTPELWARLKPLFNAALEKPPGERNAFIVEACGDDLELRRELAALVEAHAQQDTTTDKIVVNIQNLIGNVQGKFSPADIVLGRFKIVRQLGSGGMGDVYEAVDLELAQTVALKSIRPDIAGDDQVVSRFKKEVQLARRLGGPNLCRIHELFVIPGDGVNPAGAFLTMEFLDGVTLADRVQQSGPIAWRDAQAIVADICVGLSTMHEVGIIHRDLKSRNIMLVDRGGSKRAVLMDFGLAREVSDSLSTAVTALTAPGTCIGTPEYMAPEQFESKDLSPATDIYAMGVVLYEMLTGKRPFAAPNALRAAVLRSRQPDPASSIQKGIPRRCDLVICRCLEYDPNRRYQSAAELLGALRSPFRAFKKIQRRDLELSRMRDLGPVLGFGLVGVALILMAAVIFYKYLTKHHPQDPHIAVQSSILDRSVAVLPFQESGDTPESFSFGFTEEVMNALSQVPDLRVIGPETSFRYKASETSAIDIGRELGVRYLLIGSVHHYEHRVQIIVRVVDSRDGSQVWSREMSRAETDVLLLPDDIAGALSHTLKISLAGAHLSGQSIDAAGLSARDLYWTGRFLFHQRSDDSVRKSLEYFRESVKHDSNFAEAYCGIADALFVLAERDLLPPEKALVEAREAAHRAVQLDDRLPAAFVSLAQVTSVYDRDLVTAERLFRHALALDPRLAPGWQWLSYQLAKQRRFPEAISAGETAVSDDPLSTAANLNLAVVYFYARSDDQAIQQSRKLSDMDPQISLGHLIIAEIFAQKGLASEAIHELASLSEANQNRPIAIRVSVEVYAKAGMKVEADKELRLLLARAKKGGVPPSFLAIAYAVTGDTERAFAWLDRACDEHDAFVSVANAYPAFDGIRSDPRWEPLMARLGLKTEMK